jgi:hypothetical protein
MRNVLSVIQFFCCAHSRICGPSTKPLRIKKTSTAVETAISAAGEALLVEYIAK